MSAMTKSMKKLIRKHGAIAHDRELSRELLKLRSEFDRWQAGVITASDLTAKIHEFHEGPARTIWFKYSTGSPELGLASAIANGLVERDEVPSEVIEYLGRSIEYFENQEVSDE